MRAFARRARASAGFTVVEVLVAATVLIVGGLSAVAMIDGANATTVANRAREAGTNLAREVVEASRGVPYPRVNQYQLPTELQTLPQLGDASALAGWQVRRRGFVFDVAVTACTVDDPKDELGTHDALSYCDGTTGGGTQDRAPDDYKRIRVDISWEKPGGGGRARQYTLINNPGAAAGPRIKGLFIEAHEDAVITSVLPSVTVDIEATLTPETISVTVDGNAVGAAQPVAGDLWSFVWSISSLVDGTYLLGARAIDGNGLSGHARTLTVTLNRYLPEAPTGFIAGRNGGAVDMEWLANSERDVAGYRTYREAGPAAPEVVCDFTEQTDCHDSSPPASTLVDYWVVALDRDPVTGELREGPPSASHTVTLLNNPPNPPTGLAATTFGGDTILSWQAPSPADPDAGDGIAFYRIYRDGQTHAARYGRTGSGSEVTFTDTATGGAQHTYWVTAVDMQLAESTFVGPVTL